MQSSSRNVRALLSWTIVALVLGLSTETVGQSLLNGRIIGTVTDESGGFLPGVNVTVTSPALQVSQVLAVSGATGEYQVLDLPPGRFRVSYELPGFGTLVRDEIIITAGFTARVDVTLRVASQSETVTVVGQAPVVDVTSTRGGANVPDEVLTVLPSATNYQDTLVLVPGISYNGPPQNGETGYRGNTGSFKSYGVTARQSLWVEGIATIVNEQPNMLAAEEVDVKTFGNTAEISQPGGVIQIIAKSGGNQFSGRYEAKGVNQALQWSNLDDSLRRRGATQPDAPVYYWNLAGDLGGRVVRDKLWFYAAFNELRNLRTVPGFSANAGPNGVYHDDDDEPGEVKGINRNANLKISYQVSPSHRLIGIYFRDLQVEPAVDASRFIPFESTRYFTEKPRQAKIEWQGTLNDRLLANLVFGRGWYTSNNANQKMAETTPNHRDLATGYQTGATWGSQSTRLQIPSRHQLIGKVSYFPVRSFIGSHQLTAGFNMWWGRNRQRTLGQKTGNYALIFDTIAGVPYTPVRFETRNYPTDGRAALNTLGAYVSDTWSPTNRLTVTLGMRGEAQHAWLPPQAKVQGTFGSAGAFPEIDVGSWRSLAPRVGVAFDLFGDGKTLIKGTYGIYHFEWNTFQDFAQQYNQNFLVTTTYRWHDLNGDKAYQPGEVNLDVNGPDFLSVTGSNNIINPDLKLQRLREWSASLERDLGGNMSLRGLYVRNVAIGQTQNINILTPYSAWNRAYTRRDAGPDDRLGTADDGGVVTVYDYDPAFRGSRFVGNMLENSDRDDVFDNYEVSLNRRKADRWFASTSLVVTKNHRWLSRIDQSPNDQYFPIDDTWETAYRFAFSYDLPHGVNTSTLVQVYSGLPGQRTSSFRAADPDGGPSLVSSSSITLRMEPWGASRGPILYPVNVRLSKRFGAGGARQFELNGDVTNVFNQNAAWGSPTSADGNGVSYLSGPTYGYVTRIMAPRALRLGVVFSL